MKVGFGVTNVSIGGFGAGKVYMDQQRRDRELLQGAFKREASARWAATQADPDMQLSRQLEAAASTTPSQTPNSHSPVQPIHTALKQAIQATPKKTASWTIEEDILLLERLHEIGPQWQTLKDDFPFHTVAHIGQRARKLGAIVEANPSDDLSDTRVVSGRVRRAINIMHAEVDAKQASRPNYSPKATAMEDEVHGVQRALNSAAAVELRGIALRPNEATLDDAMVDDIFSDVDSAASDDFLLCDGDVYHSCLSVGSSARASYESAVSSSVFSSASRTTSLSDNTPSPTLAQTLQRYDASSSSHSWGSETVSTAPHFTPFSFSTGSTESEILEKPKKNVRGGGAVAKSVLKVHTAPKEKKMMGGGRRRRRNEKCDFPAPPGSSMRMAETMQWLLMGPTQPAGAASAPSIPLPALKRSKLLQSLEKSITNAHTAPEYGMNLHETETPTSQADVWMSAFEPYRYVFIKKMLTFFISAGASPRALWE